MKLHQLTLHAFGPFAGTEHIDFDRLGEDGLFLLRGRTGAGKTSILDAVTFALYGDVPGQRDRTLLKSTHAPAESEPFVELEFTQGERRCRVWRSPHHGRPQKRDPSRIREVGQRVSLQFHQSGGWEPYTAEIQAANDEMHRLLGLDLHQFTKVILLPQGAFAEFLHASSKDKQELLERLFDTDRFTLLEKHLRELAREAEQQLKDSGTRIQMHRENLIQAAVTMVPGSPDPEGGPAADLAPVFDEPTLTELTEAELIARISQALSDRRENLRRDAEEAEAAARQAESALQELRAREESLRRHEAHAARSAAHQEQEPEIASLRDRLSRDESAEQIQTWFDAAEAAVQEHRSAETEAAAAAHAAQAALSGFSALQPEEITDRALVDTREGPSAEAAATAVEQLISMRGRLSGTDAEELETRSTDLLEAAARTQHDLAQTEQEAARLAIESDRLESTQRDLQDQLEDPEALETARESARASCETLTSRVHAQRTRDELSTRCERLRVRAQTRESVHRKLKDQHHQRLQSYLRSIARQLAGELEEGRPCLVCGSVEHPHPAVEQDPGISREDVEATQTQLQQARDQLNEALVDHRSAAEQHETVLAELHEHARGSLEDSEYALDQAREALALAERHRTEQRELRQQLESTTAQHQRIQAQHAETLHRAERAGEALHRQHTQIAEVQAAMNDLRGPYDSLQLRLAELERVLQQVRTARREIEAAAVQQAHLERARLSAAAQLEGSVFDDLTELASARLADQDRVMGRSRVQSWEELGRQLDYESNEELVREGRRRAGKGETRPDPGQLEDSATRSEASAATARDAAAALLRFDAQRETLEEHRSKLERTQLHRDTALVEQRRRSELSATINGAGPENSLKMTLTTYVLAARLERVAEAATRHLATMSENRYRLRHSDAAAGRGLRGLELKVHDDHSDVERPTSSLSGGETFMASLSMALGLAEVVQSESGGIGMESLFIDEGFGSLDEDTLEHVMGALHRLQGEGRRVGLVSHVTEMHRAIPTQLRVFRHRSGSTTEMVIP